VAQSTVKLIVDAQNAIRPLQRVNQQTQALSKSTDKLKSRLDKSNRSIRDTGKSARVASSGVKTLTGALGPLLKALALAATARFIFVKTAELQTQRTALIQLTGSVEDANKIISQLQAFGNVTPFTSSELIEQSKRLKAFGFETENLVDTVQRLSDVAGATGADLSGISTAFGQILAKGKLQREEELQLLERGVDITSELKRITKLQGQEFETAMRKGKIGADLVNQALINLTSEGGVFFEGATKQSKTLNGQVSTLEDNIDTLARIIGTQLEPALMKTLQTANKVLGAINRILSSEFQRQISGFRSNLLIPGDTLKDLKKIEDFTKNIQPLGMDVMGLDLAISQLQGTRDQINKLMSGMSGRSTVEEDNQSLETNRAITAKINELIKRKNLLLDINEKTNKKIEESNKNNKDNIINTLEVSDLFNQNLEITNGLINGISLGTNAFSTELENATSDADKLKEKFMEIGQAVEDGIVQNLTNAAMGTKSLGDAAISVLNDLKRKLIEVAMQQAVSGLGNFLGTALSGLFGGGGGGLSTKQLFSSGASLGINNASDFLSGAPPLKFANGGRPPVGRASIVGEKGPELFVPSSAGNIIPNNAIGGVTNNININVDASGSSVQGNDSNANQFGEQLAAAIQAEIINQKRSGGLLN